MGNAHSDLDRFLKGTESADDDYTVAGNNFNSLLKEALDNLSLFTPAQRRFIEDSKRKTFLPKHRLARCRARSRSQSRSRSPSASHQQSLSSEESFASTSTNSTVLMDDAAKKKAAEEAAAKKAAEESAALNSSSASAMSGRVALIKLKFDEE